MENNTPKIINVSIMIAGGNVTDVINNSKYKFDTDYIICVFENAVKNLRAGMQLDQSLEQKKYDVLKNLN